MRLSPLRHPLAVLRTTIGFTQKELASLVGCSRPTIQAIELQRLNMSAELAQKIAYRTGISGLWLLGNDPNQPPVCADGSPFTRETFEAEQASFQRPATRQGELEAIRLEIITAVERLATTCMSAYHTADIWLWTYKVEELLQTLVTQFGEDASLKKLAEKYYPEMKKRRPLVQPIIDKWSAALMAAALHKLNKRAR